MLSLALLALLSGTAHGQITGLKVSASPGPPGEARPSEIVTLGFVVRNAGPVPRLLDDEIDLPEGWRLVSIEEPFRLPAGGEEVRLVTFRLPRPPLAPAGLYVLTYRVHVHRRPDRWAEATVGLTVQRVLELELAPLAPPSLVVAGRDYTARFVLVNRGNVGGQVVVDVMSSDDLKAEADAKTFPLAPGASREIAVIVHTDAAAVQPLTHQLRLGARLAGERGGETRAATLVNIVPRISQRLDPYRRLRSRLTAQGGTEQDKNAGQFDLTGGGALDDAGRRRLDFHLQRPIDPNLPLFGFREEYNGALSFERGSVKGGDLGYSLSPLTQLYEYGRGAQADLHAGGFEFGGFSFESRGQSAAERGRAGYIGYAAKPLELKANWLGKDAATRQDLASLQAKTGAFAGLALAAEYALGRSPLDKTPYGNRAWSAVVEGKAFGRAPLRVEKTRGGPDYTGFYHDSDLTRAQVAAPLGARWELNEAYYKDVFNLNRDPTKSVALDQDRTRTGVRFLQSREATWTLDYDWQSKRDRLPTPSFDARAQQLTAGAVRQWRAFRASLSAAAIRFEDRLSGHSFEQGGGGADLSLAATPSQSYSAYVQRGPQGLAVDVQPETVAGLGADLLPLQGLSIDLQAERREPTAPAPPSMRYIGYVRWNLLRSDIFSVRLQRLAYLGSARPRIDSVLASYSREFDIPIGLRADVGGLAGSVYDAGGPGRRGIKDAVVNAGGALSATDGRGRFAFRSLDKGEHFVWVDPATLPAGLVTDAPMPLKVAIDGGKTQHLDIGVVREAEVDLHVALYEPEGGAPSVAEENREPRLIEAGGVAGLWIELKRGEETVAHPTDADGNLRLRNLRPGRWTVRLDASGLPERHAADRDVFELELAAGQTRAERINVRPRLRRLKMIDEQ